MGVVLLSEPAKNSPKKNIQMSLWLDFFYKLGVVFSFIIGDIVDPKIFPH